MEDIEQLYHLYSRQLFKYLFYISGNRHLAEELLQETFYQAIKSIFRFKGNSKVLTWLYQIAKKCLLQTFIKSKKRVFDNLNRNRGFSTSRYSG